MTHIVFAVSPGDSKSRKNSTAQVLEPGKNFFTGVDDFEKAFGKPTTLEIDLLTTSAAVFAADRACKRGEREDISRAIELVVPVFNLDLLLPQTLLIERLLRFLSHDDWKIRFVSAAGQKIDDSDDDAALSKPKNLGRTLLFSGGMDSLAAAIEFGANQEKLTLSSHVTRNSATDGAQRELVEHLEALGYSFDHVQFFVSSADGGSTQLIHAAEPSQRTRSFVFLTLGVLCGRRTRRREIIMMAENGQMAIHLPLSSARIGAFSTHTAHPRVLATAQQLFENLLDCSIKIWNPYVYATKSEVVAQTCNAFPSLIELSTSCWKNSRPMKSGARHCGECVPCLIRHIAISKHCADPTLYGRSLLDEDVSALGEDDDGRRNLADLCEFSYLFRSASTQDLMTDFPELYAGEIDASKTIEMYRRFAKESFDVLSSHKNLNTFLS